MTPVAALPGLPLCGPALPQSLLRKMTDSLPDVWQVGELFSENVTWTTERLAYFMDSGALPGWASRSLEHAGA
jgi:hypothetical protein